MFQDALGRLGVKSPVCRNHMEALTDCAVGIYGSVCVCVKKLTGKTAAKKEQG